NDSRTYWKMPSFSEWMHRQTRACKASKRCICDRMPALGEKLESSNHSAAGIGKPSFRMGGQLSSDEAGLLDAVAFVTGGQEEGAIPQGFETRWRRTVHERKIEYQAIGPNAGFGQADDPHRDSRHVRIGVTITSPTKCVFKTVVTTEYSRGAGESFGEATSEVATLDF